MTEQMTTTAADTRETPSLISSEKVQGTPVRRPDGDKIGTIEHLMIEKGSGQVAYAVMSFGGFLGMGKDHYALPWRALHYNPRLDAYELDIEERILADAPRLPEDRWSDRTWELQIHNYFGYPPYWQ